MQYQSVEDNLFFQHSVALTCARERIKELDEHLQSYGRRNIDWEILSQTKAAKKMDREASFRGKWRAFDFTKKDGESVFFKKKTDAVRFKLSWDECQPKDPYDFGLTSYFTKMAGISASTINSFYPSISPLYAKKIRSLEDDWVFNMFGSSALACSPDGQYLLDLDGKIEASKNKSIKILDGSPHKTDWFDISQVRATGNSIKMYQAKARGFRNQPMTNPCTEIDLGSSAPASSSDSSSSRQEV